MLRFSFKHTFEKVSETTSAGTHSPNFYHGSTRWKMIIRTCGAGLKEKFQITFFGLPQHEDTLFEIKANYKVIITSHVEGKADYTKEVNEARFSKEKGGQRKGNTFYGIPVDEMKKKDFYLLKDDEMTVSVDIDIISINGIDFFPLYYFDKEFKDSDVIASIHGEEFHLHSQILSFHSEYFRELLQNSLKNEEVQVGLKFAKKQFDLKVGLKTAKKKFDFKVGQKATKKELSVDLKEKFNSYLLRTYFSILYGKNLINELNVKDLLKLNSIWRSDTISAQVEMYMASNLNLLNIPIEEVIVLAWKYNFHSLKLIVLEEMTSIDIFKKISNLEDYKTLKEGTKSDLTEQILLKITLEK